jgi:dihydrofolate reductase
VSLWVNPVIMGRKTWESLKGPLPGRENIVVTRQAGYQASSAAVAGSLDAALALCAGESAVCVIGGEQIFEEALPLAAGLIMTEIKQDFAGDARFPDYDRSQWRETQREAHHRGKRHALRLRAVRKGLAFRLEDPDFRQREAVELARVGGGVGSGVADVHEIAFLQVRRQWLVAHHDVDRVAGRPAHRPDGVGAGAVVRMRYLRPSDASITPPNRPASQCIQRLPARVAVPSTRQTK